MIALMDFRERGCIWYLECYRQSFYILYNEIMTKKLKFIY